MFSNNFSRIIDSGQIIAMAIFGLSALSGAVASGLAFAGILPWPEISVVYGGETVAWAGMALQVGVTALLLLITVFLPSARKVRKLEFSHRRFEINMDDVTRAYRAAHMADRAEMFGVVREFDAVRERYQFLKSHPDLPEMDSELLTIAAQMSEQTHEMAQVYSDAKVARAKESLKQRLIDAEALQEKIQQAHSEVRDIKRKLEDVDMEESSVASQMQQLREAVSEIGVFGPEFVPGRRVPHLMTVPAE